MTEQVARVNVGTVVILVIVTVLALVVAGCGGGGGDSESAARTSGCKHLAEAAQKFSAFATGSDSDLDTFAEELPDLAVFSFLAAVPGAPDEIRDDLQVLDKALSKYLDAIADVDL